MAIVGDLAGFKRAQKQIEKVARGGGSIEKRMKSAVVRAVKDLVKEQFAKGINPEGTPQKRRADGSGPGLMSEKLARGALDARIVGNAIMFFAKVSKGRVDAMLTGHQAGVVFPPRKGGGGFMERDARGRLISHSRFVRLASGAAKAAGKEAGSSNFVRERRLKSGKIKSRFIASRSKVSEHAIGRRTLPQRPIYPTSATLPSRWDVAIAAKVREVLEAWASAATGTQSEKLLARWENRGK